MMLMRRIMMIIIPPSPSLTEVYCRGSQTSLAQGGSEGISLRMYQGMDFVIGFPITVY